ncbi:hypothetical protein ABEW32_15425 [Paenibacillus jamilae]|nr:hypothetical protein [Paenibacillus polymyxa]
MERLVDSIFDVLEAFYDRVIYPILVKALVVGIAFIMVGAIMHSIQ